MPTLDTYLRSSLSFMWFHILVGENVGAVKSRDLDKEYSSHKLSGEEKNTNRINLNDLLKRAKEEKAKMKKNNLIIFSGVLLSALFVVVIISFL